MPGSVANAVTADVLPFFLARAYTSRREYAVAENAYPDGSSQRRLMVATSRRGWKQTGRLTAAQTAAQRAFFLAHVNAAFYFYDVHLTDPPFTYDETGVAETGRFVVRYEGGWDQTSELDLTEAAVELIEVA